MKNLETYVLINKSNDKLVSGPFTSSNYAMNEANKWYALYNIKCKVIIYKTNKIIYEVPGK